MRALLRRAAATLLRRVERLRPGVSSSLKFMLLAAESRTWRSLLDDTVDVSVAVRSFSDVVNAACQTEKRQHPTAARWS
jgi:hypothetical protein